MNKQHMWLMLALCLVPLVALGAITVFNIPVNGVIWFLLVALCPLSHIAMLWLMPHAHEAPPDQPKGTQTHDPVPH